jgi:hypothetical protein
MSNAKSDTGGPADLFGTERSLLLCCCPSSLVLLAKEGEEEEEEEDFVVEDKKAASDRNSILSRVELNSWTNLGDRFTMSARSDLLNCAACLYPGVVFSSCLA